MADIPQNHANEAQLAEKKAEAYRLRLRGLTLRQAAAKLGVSHQTIANWSRAEADATVLPLANELRTQQLERLDQMRQSALEVLERYHVVVNQGRVVELDGTPIEDDAPVLAAIDRLLKIEERRSKLMGLDAPVRSEIEARVEPKPATLIAKIEAAREAVARKEAELGGSDE